MRHYGLIMLVVVCLCTGIAGAGEAWPQWGGVNRDFTVPARELARDWGEDGPRELWSRDLGGGFSAIVSDGKSLYTHYRDGDDEIVVSLDPSNGETRWEHRYGAPIPKANYLSTQYGKGPNATPLIVDGKIVTMGFMGHVVCVDAKNGELQWSHDLGKELEVQIPYFGHATSPLQVGGNVVIVAGGVHAFALDSGKLTWSNTDFEGSYGSPILLETDGKPQVVAPVDGHVAGFDPKNGKTLWSKEHKNQWGTILTSPVVDDTGRVFISASQVGGLLLDPASDSPSEAIWHEENGGIDHSNAVRAGDLLFASMGESTSFMTATSLKDGKQLWKARGFSTANLIKVGDDYLLLDFEGELALVELSADGMTVVTKATINKKPTWTPPTLLGTTVYFRDEARIGALDLSAGKE